MGQLKTAIYARMEEVSFRSGAAVAGGVLTAGGLAITLAVVLGGPGGTPTPHPFNPRWLPGAPHLPGQPGWWGWRRPPGPWPWGL